MKHTAKTLKPVKPQKPLSKKFCVLAELLRFGGIFLLFTVTILVLKIPAFVAEEQKQIVIEYTSFNLRDPFESLIMKKGERSQTLAGKEGIGEEKATAEVNLPQFSLQGIIWNAPIPQAIIDDKIVKIGDRVKEAEVLDINKEGVTLLFQNKKFIITTGTRNSAPP